MPKEEPYGLAVAFDGAMNSTVRRTGAARGRRVRAVAGIAKPSALQAFELHMADADELVALVRALTNSRQRAMRTELRQRVGEALKVPERDRSRLACIESADLFVTFRPGSRIGPSDIADLRPLLRQALVAACTALETYLADKIMEQVGPLLRKQEPHATPRSYSTQLD